MSKYDFSGYATKSNIRCTDDRVILRDAFKDDDGKTVPLVYQHIHNDPTNILGHAVLENREDGVYAYCSFNESEKAKATKEAVRHGDVASLSIYANRLKQNGTNVVHGVIREVSVVLAGANPGAFIDNLCFSHSDGSEYVSEDEAIIYNDDSINFEIEHADSDKEEEKEEKEVEKEKTVEDVINSMTEDQKNVMYFAIGQALENESEDEEESAEYSDDSDEFEHSDIEGETDMNHNVFDAETAEEHTLSHAEVEAIFADAKRSGSLKDAALSHGIEDMDVLFPEAKTVTPTPELIARRQEWVSKVWNGTRKSPFSRVKSVAADLTADDARARGYVKGKQKVEEVFPLLSRVTTPQTVYKLQKLDRDDVIDIIDFDVVAWMKSEMRMMLDEELSRAVLIGDGRTVDSNDKIKEANVRPIYTDSDVYTIKYPVTIAADADETDTSNAFVDAALRSRKDYMGSGNPTMFASVDVINDMLLAKDKMGRRMYATLTELADALRVKEIVEVPVMEGVTRTATLDGGGSETRELKALIVNLQDYTIGADKGGAVTLFDDFDLNFNKYEYLIETRCSGALTKPYSAIALETIKTTAQG